MMYLVIIIYISIALVQIPSLIKKKYWREVTVFSIFWACAFIFSLLLSLDVTIPSPLKMLQYGVQDKYHLHY